jgi:eukaryotic-like serine/threonine-protein kinase
MYMEWMMNKVMIRIGILLSVLFAAGCSSTPVTPTPTPSPTQVSTKDGMAMILIPAGDFKMGNNQGKQSEKPEHTVYLDSYWIDRIEVTNAMYQKCVEAGKCSEPYGVSSDTIEDYYNNTQYADYPVVWVNWVQAEAYCKWAGRRLPTEAEWEKAARGTDGRSYPWGNEPVDKTRVLINGRMVTMSAGGSFPAGASPYGVMDMAGNANEWVADWYSPEYYKESPEKYPLGPRSGEEKVLRGGANVRDRQPMTAKRMRDFPIVDIYLDGDGIRCAMDGVL